MKNQRRWSLARAHWPIVVTLIMKSWQTPEKNLANLWNTIFIPSLLGESFSLKSHCLNISAFFDLTACFCLEPLVEHWQPRQRVRQHRWVESRVHRSNPRSRRDQPSETFRPRRQQLRRKNSGLDNSICFVFMPFLAPIWLQKCHLNAINLPIRPVLTFHFKLLYKNCVHRFFLGKKNSTMRTGIRI